MSDTTPYRKDLKDRILRTAMEAFFKKGVRAVKMDDIANALSISKRTLYEIFENKEVLLFEGMKLYHNEKVKELTDYVEKNANNVMDVMLKFYHCQIEELSVVSPTYYYDIHHYPIIEQYFESEAAKNREKAMTFFHRGIKEGYFRSDINYEIVSEVCKRGISQVLESGMYNKYSLSEIFTNFIMVFFRGICTERGVAVLEATNSK